MTVWFFLLNVTTQNLQQTLITLQQEIKESLNQCAIKWTSTTNAVSKKKIC